MTTLTEFSLAENIGQIFLAIKVQEHYTLTKRNFEFIEKSEGLVQCLQIGIRKLWRIFRIKQKFNSMAAV